MSEWKVGDKAYVPVTIIDPVLKANGKILVLADGEVMSGLIHASMLLRSIPPQPAPVDVSQIKVGDEVTVWAKVIENDNDNLPVHVRFREGNQVWLNANEIATHTPSRPPSTLDEFKAMTDEQQERWFAEMVKGKVVA